MKARLRTPATVGAELLITAGVVVVLFAVYQLVWTNVDAARAQATLTQELRTEWERTQGPRAVQSVPAAQPSPAARPGRAVALLHIPRLDRNWRVPIVEGVRLDDLDQGVGHYPDTARPGEVGNMAIAGHRATNGQPFRNLDRMRPGDAVVVETRDTWFTYVVDGIDIVDPHRWDVVAPVPKHPGRRPTARLLTLTTCHPRWGSTSRLVIHATLATEQDKTDGRPMALRD